MHVCKERRSFPLCARSASTDGSAVIAALDAAGIASTTKPGRVKARSRDYYWYAPVRRAALKSAAHACSGAIWALKSGAQACDSAQPAFDMAFEDAARMCLGSLYSGLLGSVLFTP